MTEEYQNILDKIFIEIIVELQKTELNSKLVGVVIKLFNKNCWKKVILFYQVKLIQTILTSEKSQQSIFILS